MLQRVVDGRLQVAELLAGVIAFSFENVSVEVALADQRAHRIGQLNLAARAALRLLKDRENLWRQNIAPDDRVPRRSVALRFLHHVRDAKAAVAFGGSGNDSIA